MESLVPSAGQKLLELGLPGIVILLLVAAVVVLDRRLNAVYEKLIQMNAAMAAAVTESTAVLRGVKEAQETAADASRESSEAVRLLTAKLNK